jgi:hypothetical protein
MIDQFILDHQRRDAHRRRARSVPGAAPSAHRVRNPYTEQRWSARCPRPRWTRCARPSPSAAAYKPTLTRFERANILNKAAAAISARARVEIAGADHAPRPACA